MKPTRIPLLLIGCLLLPSLGAGEQAQESIIPAPGDIAAMAHPLEPEITRFLKRDLTVKPSGITKADYLRVLNDQVMVLMKYQGEDGTIQNPLTGQDRNYATPHFAHCAAVLIATGTNTSPELYQAAARAMTYSMHKLREGIHPLQLARRDGTIPLAEFQREVQKLREQNINAFGAADFFPLPVMKAMPLFQAEVAAGRIDRELFAEWEAALRAVDPQRAYNWYLTPTTDRWSSNWAIKNGTGEWLREQLGYSDHDYAKVVLECHAENFTPFGMFREQAFCYDLFPRAAIVTILAKGYRGEYFETLRAHMWRGAWTSLFVQSPNGELPPGFRSAAHIWNETMQVQLFETYATACAEAGLDREAGIFKRAAHLAFQSVAEWIRPDGEGLKNIGLQFPALIFDGEERSAIDIQGDRVALNLRGTGVVYETLDPDLTFQRETTEFTHVNGLANRISTETNGQTLRYRIKVDSHKTPRPADAGCGSGGKTGECGRTGRISVGLSDLGCGAIVFIALTGYAGIGVPPSGLWVWGRLDS